MFTIIMRSALVFHGCNPSPDTARIEIDDRGDRHVITWADVLNDRRESQRKRLAQKRYVEPWRAVRLTVAYYDQSLMGGWQAMLDDWRGHYAFSSVWIDRDGKGFIANLMRLYPMPQTLFGRNDWGDWKEWFAGKYKRRTQDRKPLGVAMLWKRGYELKLPAKKEPKQ
jgi:hypothetical protein